MSVVSVLPIAVRPGAEEGLVRAFRELRVLEHARRSGGLVAGRLLRPLGPGEPFLVVAEWESQEAYERWLASPLREELAARLEPLLAGSVRPGGLYVEAG
jgi:heme-degrading monooxygenase HmoA